MLKFFVIKNITLIVFIFIAYSSLFAQKKIPFQKDFNAFQQALIKDNISNIKKHIAFPIKSDKHKIWELTHGSEHGKNQPFLETDFDAYYDKIFPELVRKSLVNIAIDTLCIKGNFTSKKIEQGFNYAYTNALYYKDKNLIKVEINTFNPFVYEGQIDEEEDDEQIIYTYFFKIEKNKKIQLIDLNKHYQY